MIYRFIIVIVIIAPLNLLGQDNALIIKHTGISDATIYPVVFLPDSITDEFSKKHLKYLKNFTIKPKWVTNIKVSIEELSGISSLACRLAENVNDTSKFSYRKGNFDIVWIASGKVEKKISINNLEKSLEFLNNFLHEMDSTLSSYTLAYEAIEYLIEQLQPNPTIEIVSPHEQKR